MSRMPASLIRASAFLRKEIAEVRGQPRLLLTLVIGPFVILLIFGAGLRETDPELSTIFVAPTDDHELIEEVREFAEEQTDRLIVERITDDEPDALRRLRDGDVQLVIVFPENAAETVRSNEQAVVTLYHDQMDPLENQAILLYMASAVDEVNRQILARVVGEGQEDSAELEERVARAREQLRSVQVAAERGDEEDAAAGLANLRADTAALMIAAGPAAALGGGESTDTETFPGAVADFSGRLDELDDPDDVSAQAEELDDDLAAMEDALGTFQSIAPEVLVAPFRGEAVRIEGADVNLSAFYAPAVVVVLLQHMMVTFVALSIVRERELGTTELYRIAPLRASEFIAGKCVAHVLLGIVVGAVLLAGLVLGLGVPIKGSLATLALVLFVVLCASASLGFVVAAISRTDSQAVQYTMLVLLATIFFSGFTLSLDRFIPAFSWIGYLLPATYGIDLLRDVMLRGALGQPLALVVLALFGLVLGVTGGLGLRRSLLRA